MALNKSALQASIKALLSEEKEKTDNASSIDNIASKLASAIDLFVKSGTVNSTVTTTGNAAAQAGTGIGTIS